MKIKEDLKTAISFFVILVIIAIVIFPFVVGYKKWIGPAVFVFGLLPWIPVKLAGRSIKSISADIIYGLVDGSILAIFAVTGAELAGVLGAVFGTAAGNAISDGFGGLWEGKASQWLRKHNVKEARTPLSASMGKMSGVALGAAVILIIAWTIL